MQALIDVAGVFGASWASEKAVPLLLSQLEDSFYLYRITCLQVRPSPQCLSCQPRGRALWDRPPVLHISLAHHNDHWFARTVRWG
jgi:hypothetical protein